MKPLGRPHAVSTQLGHGLGFVLGNVKSHSAVLMIKSIPVLAWHRSVIFVTS